jgi:dTDP-4-amino-4,6-dideoxygalactose transaminase
VSTLTFGASAFAVTYAGARPCFIDCEPVTWHLDPGLLREELQHRAADGRLPAAVVSVDLYGAVADNRAIADACAEFDVPLVEDAAEALGAFRDGMHAGRAGRIGVLSFNGNKIVTTGGGGAVMSDDPALVQRVRHRATQARQPVPWYEHDEIGFNYRMGNLNAAVGRGQLRTLPQRIAERRRVRNGYERHLAGLPGVSFQQPGEGCEPNHWLTTVRFHTEAFGATPSQLVTALRESGIEARHGFKPMHQQPVFAAAPVVGGAVADDLFATTVSLPSGSRLTDEQVEWISGVVASLSR